MTRLVHISTIAESLRAFRDQLVFMKSQGLDVQAVSADSPYRDCLERETGVPVHCVPLHRSIRPWEDWSSLGRLTDLLGELRPDIVHAHTPKGGLLGVLAARRAGVPVKIYHLRGLRYVTARGWQRVLLKRCERMACRVADQVLCVSHSLRRQAIDDGIVAAAKVRVLGNGGHGMDAAVRFNPRGLPAETRDLIRDRYQIPRDACVVGFVGRMVVDKGLVELAAAWRQLRPEFRRLHLLLVGPLESQSPLPPAASELLRGDERVHWIGANFDTPPLYRAMDIACLPSHREGLPKMPLEAAAMELPVVTTDVPGCRDSVLAARTAAVVPVGDARGLAQALRGYIANPELRKLHGERGRRWVLRSFQPGVIQQAMLAEYQRLLAATTRPLTSPPGGSDERHQKVA